MFTNSPVLLGHDGPTYRVELKSYQVMYQIRLGLCTQLPNTDP